MSILSSNFLVTDASDNLNLIENAYLQRHHPKKLHLEEGSNQDFDFIYNSDVDPSSLDSTITKTQENKPLSIDSLNPAIQVQDKTAEKSFSVFIEILGQEGRNTVSTQVPKAHDDNVEPEIELESEGIPAQIPTQYLLQNKSKFISLSPLSEDQSTKVLKIAESILLKVLGLEELEIFGVVSEILAMDEHWRRPEGNLEQQQQLESDKWLACDWLVTHLNDLKQHRDSILYELSKTNYDKLCLEYFHNLQIKSLFIWLVLLRVGLSIATESQDPIELIPSLAKPMFSEVLSQVHAIREFDKDFYKQPDLKKQLRENLKNVLNILVEKLSSPVIENVTVEHTKRCPFTILRIRNAPLQDDIGENILGKREFNPENVKSEETEKKVQR